ncbi:25S rRNA adenine-N(1) methyltransferase-like [Actinia tenebrosa]|uniref:S-adenosylmethionine sensor upstream of mTORC1 n=1 Tax=Actinia tenebrosa TaxID=6105 RepID=A0A6P8IMB7_ACTTE|nr:25S rRNA adenine-N(1) methyltransferase-like [Actinia tenebrosa]
MADGERESTADTTHKKKKKKTTKKKPVTFTKPSIRKDEKLINKYHALKKLQEAVKKDSQLQSEKKAVKLNELNTKLEKLGGIDAYQEASRLGEKRYGGFNSAKWVLKQLKENGIHPDKDHKFRLLDVGALSCNYTKQKSWIDCTSIDLNPQNHMIMEADFLQIDCKASQYDIVVLSLVINFEGDPVKRGEMLKQCTKIIAKDGYLFVVLPLPCLMNSRFSSKELFLSMTQSLGFKRIAQHSSRRLYFVMFKNTGNVNFKSFPRKITRKGDGHNNFVIVL